MSVVPPPSITPTHDPIQAWAQTWDGLLQVQQRWWAEWNEGVQLWSSWWLTSMPPLPTLPNPETRPEIPPQVH